MRGKCSALCDKLGSGSCRALFGVGQGALACGGESGVARTRFRRLVNRALARVEVGGSGVVRGDLQLASGEVGGVSGQRRLAAADVLVGGSSGGKRSPHVGLGRLHALRARVECGGVT